MPPEEFRSTKTLSNAVRILLLTGIAIDGAYIFTVLAQLNWFPDLGNDAVQPTESEIAFSLWLVGVALLNTLVYLTTGIMFLVWFSRSYKNLVAIGVNQLRASPTWAVVSWFIPIVNFWIPLRSMNEIRNCSHADDVGETTIFSDVSTPALHGFWWAFWILGSLILNIAFRASLRAESNESLLFINVAEMIGGLLMIGAGYFLYEIVGDITANQEKIANQVIETGPPEPPDFGNAPNFLVQE